MAKIIKICTCTQCKGSKKKIKNRKVVQKIKRALNKQRRVGKEGTVKNHYWA
jgi:hypothetical protein